MTSKTQTWYYCDACGVELKDYGPIPRYTATVWLGGSDNPYVHDICQECRQSLIQWLESRKKK